MMTPIRFLRPYLLWNVGEVQPYNEGDAIELVAAGIAEFVDEPETAEQTTDTHRRRRSR